MGMTLVWNSAEANLGGVLKGQIPKTEKRDMKFFPFLTIGKNYSSSYLPSKLSQEVEI